MNRDSRSVGYGSSGELVNLVQYGVPVSLYGFLLIRSYQSVHVFPQYGEMSCWQARMFGHLNCTLELVGRPLVSHII